MFPACPILYLLKYFLLLSYWLVPTSSAVTELRMEQVGVGGIVVTIAAFQEWNRF